MDGDYQSTIESDIERFQESTQDKIVENDLLKNSVSGHTLENLIKEYVSNSFLDDKVCDDQDSKGSESSFSGYVNELNDKRKKSDILRKTGVISDNTYFHVNGIIARKKTTGMNDIGQSDFNQYLEKGKTMTTENDDTSLHSSANELYFHKDSIVDLVPSWGLRLPSSSKFDENMLAIHARKYDSDSSDSILGDTFPRPTRQRKRKKGKNKSKGSVVKACVSNHENVIIKSRRSPRGTENNTIQATSRDNLELDLNTCATGYFRSVTNKTGQRCGRLKQQLYSNKLDSAIQSSSGVKSKLYIDTTNVILPSLVKKGIRYYDIPRIEFTLSTILSKVRTMNRKQKVLDQLRKNRAYQIDDAEVTKNGMALMHKLRAERKMALQATYLRYARHRLDNLEDRSKLVMPTCVKINSSSLEPILYQKEAIVLTARKDKLHKSHLSLSSSTFEEKNRLKSFINKTKRELSCPLIRHDRGDLFDEQTNQHYLSSFTHSSPSKIQLPKTPPLEKLKFTRSKETIRYEVLSPSSCLSHDLKDDSGNVPMKIRKLASKNRSDVQLQSSDCSEWSEMSFLSESNGFEAISRVSSSASQRNIHQPVQSVTIKTSQTKTFNDSFDEIILRKSPNERCKNRFNHAEDNSPTGVLDFVPKFQWKQEGDNGDIFAFVDEGEVDLVFTDKDDIFAMKSPDQIRVSQFIQPLFFSPRRFEI